MPESMSTTAKSTPLSAQNFAPVGASDLRTLAQVEKWMAMIRDLNREQQGQSASQR
jgi:hypothetical protein